MKVTRSQLRRIIKEELQLENVQRLFPLSDLPQPSDHLGVKVDRLVTLMTLVNDNLPDRIYDLENQMKHVISSLESQDDTTMIWSTGPEDIEDIEYAPVDDPAARTEDDN